MRSRLLTLWNICRFPPTSLEIFKKMSSTRASITRINRNLYGRMYPVQIALTNGATIRIRYKEPRYLLQLPLALDECDEEERARRLLRQKSRSRLELNDDTEYENSFDASAYDFLWSKPRPE